MTDEPKPAEDEVKHRDAMERHTRPSLWGPASWWRAGIVGLALVVIVMLLVRSL